MGKIGFGGGCHWCTEAVFQSLEGVLKVEQGFISPTDAKSSFSEAVIVHYDHKVISLKDLIQVHLLTHNSTSNHSMREKYRSAIYAFGNESKKESIAILNSFQEKSEEQIITKVLSFWSFEPSDERFQNYYFSNPQKPFCETHIHPKLSLLREQFSNKIISTKDEGF